ncbi:LeuA family protein [Leisingera daeponensis]|uniref:LeuA family protein n=1 Tax=Leisingera daeponensis TaxID=405746 RepID=UPI0006888D5D|nr:LeuA family protein [Leisingera daeponensis]
MSSPADLLVHDWNSTPLFDTDAVQILDDTLRDGLQSPAAFQPHISQKKVVVDTMSALGVHGVTLGLPGSGEKSLRDIIDLARHISESHYDLEMVSAVRTHPDDVAAHIRSCEVSGQLITASLFVGSSPIRRTVEEWSLSELMDMSMQSIRACVREGLPVMFVTEDTTRSRPQDIATLYKAAIDEGASRICVADTVGSADMSGTRSIIEFAKTIIEKSGADVKLDWHGHNDRGLALANSLTALQAGADRIHATVLGLGERTGNTALDQMLVNLRLMGAQSSGNFEQLMHACNAVSTHCNAPLPDNYPALGRDAFRTSTGVHAAAVAKARNLGDAWLADRIYSSVPASWFGLEQKIEVGPMSGRTNVEHWLNQNCPGMPTLERDDAVVSILAFAKNSPAILTDRQIQEVLETSRRKHIAKTTALEAMVK